MADRTKSICCLSVFSLELFCSQWFTNKMSLFFFFFKCTYASEHTCAHTQSINSIVGICATVIYTFKRWVDFPMAMSKGQSVVIQKNPKGPASPADPPSTDPWVTQPASLKPLLRRVRPYSVLILVDNLVPWKSEEQNEAVLTRSLPHKSGGFGENKEETESNQCCGQRGEGGRNPGCLAA